MRTFSKVLAVVLCVAMLFTTAFASGLKVSFVDFQENNGNITARVNLRNDDSANASGKIIVASYDANGNLVATGESLKTEVAKGAETIISASVASGAASYKAFVWNDTVNANSVHAVAGATAKTDFAADTGVDNAFVSAKSVATSGMTASKPELKLYSPFKGRTADDASEATGGRVTVSNFPANSLQYHEVYYADPSLVGLDFFVFSAGTIDYSAKGSPLLTFDIVRDSEIIILATNQDMEFEGFDLITAEEAAANGESFAEGRYMTREFADGLNAIGIRPTYAMARAYVADKDAFYEETIKAAYDAASETAKDTFDTKWEAIGINSWTNPGSYTAMYTKTVTLDGAESAEVVIPAESTGSTSRNLIVLVKPIADAEGSDAFVPLTSAGNINAAPALKGVEIDGTFVSASEFTDNAYSYKLNAMGDCVLPVVKGIATDSALYAATDYDIAADGKTAVATVTVKNLYTNAAPAVYTINISVDTGNLPADAYDVVNLNGKTLIDNTNALVQKTETVEAIKTHGNPLVAAPVSKVSGKTYAEYIAYVNEYYGYKEGDANYITGSGVIGEGEVVGTNSYFKYDKNFEIGNQIGFESNRRLIASVNPKYAFYRNLYRLYGSISVSQLGAHYLTGSLWYGVDHAYTPDDSTETYNVKAKTDNLPPVPWFEATMATKGTVYVNSYQALPHLVEKRGYKLISNNIAPYEGVDTNNKADTSLHTAFPGPTYIYYKVFEAGDKVEVFNDSVHATHSRHPSAWFFTTAVPDEYSYEYGKKSSAAVATYNTTTKVTDGVLYKDLFADVASSRDTSGGQWVSDYQPLGSGQRIKSIEDPSLIGCDYFAFSINNRNKLGTAPGTNILEFKVDKDAEVVILTMESDKNADFGGFTKNVSAPSLTAMFPQSNYLEAIKALGIPTTDISMDMVADFYPSSGLTFKQLYDKWLGAEFPGATEEELLNAVNVAIRKQASLKSLLDAISTDTQFFASVDSKAAAIGGSHNNYVYKVAHTKEFKAGDTVAIPDPTNVPLNNSGAINWARPIMVVVKPLVNSTITDHVTDFQIVAEGAEKTFILGPGANANVKATYSDRLVHNYTTDSAEPTVASAYSINGQRTFGITDEVLGLENCYYLRYYEQASVNSSNYGIGNGLKTLWAGGNGAEDLPWMTFTVNQDCDIVIVPSADTPNFVTVAANGWSKTTLSDYAFTLKRQANGSYQDYSSRSQKVMYTKSFKAGDTVTLYNVNTGTLHGSGDFDKLPYFAFVRVK